MTKASRMCTMMYNKEPEIVHIFAGLCATKSWWTTLEDIEKMENENFDVPDGFSAMKPTEPGLYWFISPDKFPHRYEVQIFPWSDLLLQNGADQELMQGYVTEKSKKENKLGIFAYTALSEVEGWWSEKILEKEN